MHSDSDDDFIAAKGGDGFDSSNRTKRWLARVFCADVTVLSFLVSCCISIEEDVAFAWDRISPLPVSKRPVGEVLTVRSIPCYSAIWRRRKDCIDQSTGLEYLPKVNPFKWFWFTVLDGLHRSEQGKMPLEHKIAVDFANIERFDQPISRGVFRGIKVNGKNMEPMENRIDWESIPKVGMVMGLLSKRSYLKDFLTYRVNENGKPVGESFGLRNYLARYFLGYDLSFDPPQKGMSMSRPDWENERPDVYRLKRFHRVLHNVDGLVVQLMLSFPECEWSYHLVDKIAIQSLVMALQDEVLPISSPDPIVDTTWQKTMKRFRKTVKFNVLVNNGDIRKADEVLRGTPLQWLGVFTKQMGSQKSQFNIYTGLLFCQTRGASTPSDAIVAQATRQYIRTVTSPCEPISIPFAKTISEVVRKIVRDNIPKDIRTHCMSTATAGISASACFEQMVKDGGKYEHARRVLQANRPVYQIDLETGQKVFEYPLTREGFPTEGDYYFHWCMNQIMDPSKKEYNRQVKFLMIYEPGKPRGVSKSPAAVTGFLMPGADALLSHLAFVPSSKAGVSKGAPCWDFYKRMNASPENIKNMFCPYSDIELTERIAELKFSAQDFRSLSAYTRREGSEPAGKAFTQLCMFLRVFGLSIDYSEATDHNDNNVSRVLLGVFMEAIGFPKWYGEMINNLLHCSRTLHVHVSFGKDTDEDDIVITVETSRGILMGDPVTKVVLHLINIVVTELSKWFSVSLMDLGSDVLAEGTFFVDD